MFRAGATKGVTLTLILGWKFNIPGKELNLDICCLKTHQPMLPFQLTSYPQWFF